MSLQQPPKDPFDHLVVRLGRHFEASARVKLAIMVVALTLAIIFIGVGLGVPWPIFRRRYAPCSRPRVRAFAAVLARFLANKSAS